MSFKVFWAKNSPAILIGSSIIFGGISLYAMYHATAKSEKILREMEEKDGVRPDKKTTFKVVAKNSIPVVVTAVASAACAVASYKIQHKQLVAALGTIGTLAANAKQFKEAAEKVAGSETVQTIADEVAKKRGSESPDIYQNVVVSGEDYLCYETVSQQFFFSTKEKIQEVADRVNDGRYSKESSDLNFADWMQELKLKAKGCESLYYWNRHVDGPISLLFGSGLTKDGKPYLEVGYWREPSFFGDFKGEEDVQTWSVIDDLLSDERRAKKRGKIYAARRS